VMTGEGVPGNLRAENAQKESGRLSRGLWPCASGCEDQEHLAIPGRFG
jgi:hypothetical protein